MSTQQKNGSNGTTNATGNSGKKVDTTAVVTLKKEEPKAEVKQEEKKSPTITTPIVKGDAPVEDRILRVQQLGDLVEKHETLIEAQKKLNSLKLSSDGSRDTLAIRDSKGKEFTTTNSNVIADVVETLKKSIAEKITAVETQIVF